MKIFIDTAKIEEIREAANLGIIKGVTTNPTLIARSGRNQDEVIEEILSIVDGPISSEVKEGSFEEMYSEAKKIVSNSHNENITIKVPLTEAGVKTCKVLSSEGIKVNVTLIFSLSQAILAMEAGATFISPFIGRLEDYTKDPDAGYKLIKDIEEVKKKYGYKSEVIAASIRNVEHIEKAARAGAEIATVPFHVIKEMYVHELTNRGLEIFRNDSKGK